MEMTPFIIEFAIALMTTINGNLKANDGAAADSTCVGFWRCFFILLELGLFPTILNMEWILGWLGLGLDGQDYASYYFYS